MKILDKALEEAMLARLGGIAKNANVYSYQFAVVLYDELKEIDWKETKKEHGFSKMDVMEDIIKIPEVPVKDAACLRQVLTAGEFARNNFDGDCDYLSKMHYWSFHNVARARLSNDDDESIRKKVDLIRRIISGQLPEGKIKAEINKIKDTAMPKELDELLLYFNIWNIQRPDTKFGIQHPGQIPGQIVLNLIYHYMPEDALIIDPMAGGGSTHDVCQWLNGLSGTGYDLTCHSFDLDPKREFIQQKNCVDEDWNMNGADLVFLDPPYFSMKKDEYVPNDFTASFDSFERAITTVFVRAYEALKPGGICAIIIQPQTEKDVDYSKDLVCIDTPYTCMKLMEAVGFRHYQRIQTPLSTQQFNATDMKRVKKYEERKRLLGTSRDLILMKKD